MLPSAASIRKHNGGKDQDKGNDVEIKVEENGVSIIVPESVPKAEVEESESVDSESESSGSESVTTEVSEAEPNNIEHTLPEIKINLAETEEPEPKQTESVSEAKKCDKSFGDDLDFIDDEDDDSTKDNSVDEKSSKTEVTESHDVKEEKKRSPARRRPSLLKTVVSIKSDQPVTVVNYTQTIDDVTPTEQNLNKYVPIAEPEESSPTEEPLNASLAEMEESFKTVENDLDSTKETFESFNNTMEESASLADASLESGGEVSTETECVNSATLGCASCERVVTQESVSTDSDSSGQVIPARKEQEVDNQEGEVNGNLVIIRDNALPQRSGENETSTDGPEDRTPVAESVPQESIEDIYRGTNANEKITKLNSHQQHSSNMIHDLIIGRSKQRRVRQPRSTAPVSSVPSVPLSHSPPQEPGPGEVPSARERSSSISLREASLCRSVREGSVGRGGRESSAKVSLPPTPITNPEKFGIKVRWTKLLNFLIQLNDKHINMN